MVYLRQQYYLLGRLGIWITYIRLVAIYNTYCICRYMSIFSSLLPSEVQEEVLN